GAGLLWRGDFPGARQLLTAIGRRADRRPLPKSLDLPGRFRAHRAARAERAELLGGIVVVIEPDLRLALRRAPDLAGACREAYGELSEPAMVSLNELLGVLSAWQWQQRGVRSRHSATSSTPGTACSPRSVRSTSIWSPRHRCRPSAETSRHSISAPGPASLPRCSPVGVRHG